MVRFAEESNYFENEFRRGQFKRMHERILTIGNCKIGNRIGNIVNSRSLVDSRRIVNS
jgi:hypothetical protein